MTALAPPDLRPAPPRSGGAAADPATVAGTGPGSTGALVLVLRLVGLGLSFGSAVLLGRLLGLDGLGVYETAMGWAGLLGVVAGAGAEKLVVRETAAAVGHGRFDVARGLARTSLIAVLLGGGAVALVAGVVLAALGDRAPTGLWIVAIGVVPLTALLRVRQAVLQGLARIAAGQIAELVVVPASLVALLAALAWGQDEVAPTTALACQAAACAIGLVVACGLLRRVAPSPLRTASPTTDVRGWGTAALPLLAIAGLQVLNARVDVVLLGALSEAGEVGRYASAHRLAALVAMPLLAANAALGPTLARLHARGDAAALQRAITRTVRWTCAAALPIAVALLVGGSLALSAFGPAFVAGRDLLTLLTLAQCANVAMGSVGLILLMTGHARTAMVGLATAAVLNLGLDIALIPAFGAAGAAIGAAASLLAWNVLLLVAVRRRLGLQPSILGGLR